MRICLISREYPPDSGWGGIATYTYHQANGLKELGHDVEVVALTADTGRKSKTSNTLQKDMQQSSQSGVVVRRVSSDESFAKLGMVQNSIPFSHYVLKNIFALSQKVFEINSINPFDVIEAPEHLAEGLGLALTNKVPLVIRLHTPQSKFIAEKFHNLTPSFDQQLVAMLERLAIVSCNAVTSPSQDMADFVSQDTGYRREDIHIIRNPVDSDHFCPEGAQALDAGKDALILFVGRLEERKGIHYLIKAVSTVINSCPNARFVVIGSDTNNGIGQKSVLAELQQYLKESGHTNNVIFIPHVPLSEMPKYYRSADICVVPSLYDNAPCTCLEAMSTGKPVITTSAGGSAEYVIDGECGLVVPPKDEKALAAAIIDLVKDTKKRTTLGNDGRQKVLQKYQRTEIARQSLDVYKLAIEAHAKGRTAGIYLKQDNSLLNNTFDFMQSFDKMLYDFLYVQSLNFRLKHRIKRVKSIFAESSDKVSLK